jgi:hypothetical protein
MPRQRNSEKQNKKKLASLSALGGSVRTTGTGGGKVIGKKMASLSALGAGAFLGAGALMLDAPMAEAAVVSGNPNVTLSPNSHFSNFGAGGPALQFFATSNGGSSNGLAVAGGFAGIGSKLAHYAGGSLRLFGQGAKWTTAGPLGDNGNFLVGGRFWSRTYPGLAKNPKFGGMKLGRMRLGRGGKGKRGHGGIAHIGAGNLTTSTSTSTPCCTTPTSGTSGVTHHGVFPDNPNFIDKYALFTFPNGPTTLYGWVELSLSIEDSFGPNGTPDLGVIAWAWDDTGRSLAAGDTTPATPEPATEVMTGLAALALGAEGLRRWRKARKAA